MVCLPTPNVLSERGYVEGGAIFPVGVSRTDGRSAAIVPGWPLSIVDLEPPEAVATWYFTFFCPFRVC